MYKVTFANNILKQALYPANVSIEELTERLESQGYTVVMIESGANLDQSNKVLNLCHLSWHRVPSLALFCGIAQWLGHLHPTT